MDSDNYDVIYCLQDDEYRVYCVLCDNACIERFYKNHLKSQTHALKRQQKKMHFKCDFFDTEVQNVSRNIYLKSIG